MRAFRATETGIGFDPVSGNVFITEFSDTIHEVRPNGLEVLPSFAIPGAGTDEVDLDFLPVAVNVGGTMVPAGTLLVVNGDDSPDQLYALNKDTGADPGPGGHDRGSTPIGGTYHAVRNRIFVANFSTGVITEVNPADGATFNSFPVRPAGSPPFAFSFGDLEVHPVSGNLLAVGSGQSVIRELTPTGTFVRDLDVSGLGITAMSGIAVDDANQEAWIVNTSGNVVRVNLMGGTGIGRIVNDDTAVVSITPPTVTLNEGNSGTTAFTFNVTLSNPNAGVVTVQVNTQDGTATASRPRLSGDCQSDRHLHARRPAEQAGHRARERRHPERGQRELHRRPEQSHRRRRVARHDGRRRARSPTTTS